MKKIIIVGQIPPPSHGQSIMIQKMVSGLSEKVELDVVEMRFSKQVDENGNFGFYKLIHLFHLIYKVNRLLKKYPNAILYFPASPPKWSTCLRDWVILFFIRPNAKYFVLHFHAYGLGEFLFSHKFKKFIRRPFLSPDLSIILNESCRMDADLLMSKKISIVPYGIDTPTSESCLNSPARNRIIFVGLHIESKGILDVLKIANILKKRGLHFEIHTIGPWKNKKIRESYEFLLHQYQLRDVVKPKGELVGQELWNEYKNANILIFPTFFEFETFGLVVLEAMAYKLAVVCSDWRGPSSIVQNDVSGYICKKNDINDFADKIERLLLDKDLCHKMGQSGYSIYKEKYSNKSYIENILLAFKEL